MSEFFDIAGTVLAILGALVFATAALGVLRFPDAYMRVSSVGTAGGLGIMLVITGALLMQPSISNLIKVLLILIIHLLSSAVGTMAIARAAHLTGTPMERCSFDELNPPGAQAHSSEVSERDRPW